MFDLSLFFYHKCDPTKLKIKKNLVTGVITSSKAFNEYLGTFSSLSKEIKWEGTPENHK